MLFQSFNFIFLQIRINTYELTLFLFTFTFLTITNMKTIKCLTIVLFIFTSLHANGQKDALKNLDYYFKILDTASGKEIKLKTIENSQVK